METLVRRLGRIFTLKKNDSQRPFDKLRDRRINGSVGEHVEPPNRPTSGMHRLEKALDAYVKDKGWRKPVRTVGEAAERLGTDTHTLHRYFQERVGVDFRTWRTRLRLEDAKRLLLGNPGMQAAEAGRRAGFSNRSNFARQFQDYTGLTPAQWRSSALRQAQGPTKEARTSRDGRAPENDYV